MSWLANLRAALPLAVVVATLLLLGAAQLGVRPPAALLSKLCGSSSTSLLE